MFALYNRIVPMGISPINTLRTNKLHFIPYKSYKSYRTNGSYTSNIKNNITKLETSLNQRRRIIFRYEISNIRRVYQTYSSNDR